MRTISEAASDEALLAACLRGEQAAWDALVDRYARLIYSIPLKYGLSEGDAGDVFQSVCVTLLEKLGTIRDPRRLAAWLITTTTRESWALVRERGRPVASAVPSSRRGDAGGALPPDESVDPAPLPEEELLALERRALVRNAVAQLSGGCRRLVEALFADTEQRWSYQELAAALGIPVNSLGPTRARCLAKLRRLLDAAGYTM
jgi:RNA polymerase sigma factor (sigma-70 family)